MRDYPDLLEYLESLEPGDQHNTLRALCRTDLYFLLRYPLGRADIEVDWLFARCREVESNPDGRLDLWARAHYKSTIITFAKTIQDLLASHGDDPLECWPLELTVGIFSHTRPIAKGFLRQIMREFETNQVLIDLFPDILWNDPKKDAPKWSEDDGLVLQRKSNPKESTVEAWGMVDSQPTSKHFGLRVYDDVVTQESVRSPDMMAKTTQSWELSLNLGTRDGIERYIGTRYHYNDTYKHILGRKAAIPRLYPATQDGRVEGEPVLLTREELDNKRRSQGPYTYSCQMLLNPVADSAQGFKREWLKFYSEIKSGQGLNLYILVDPANEKKKKSDYTAMIVIGCGVDGNIYVLDMVRDRLSLTERTAKLFELHRRWKQTNQKIIVGYEKYGKDADIEHIRDKQEQETYHFDIMAIGGTMSKHDRIRRLIPDFEQGTVYFPKTLNFVNHEQQALDLVQTFVDEEFVPFPVGEHDDMIDALARLKDVGIQFPLDQNYHQEEFYVPKLVRI